MVAYESSHLAPRSILIMVMNTISPISIDHILHANLWGESLFQAGGRESRVKYHLGQEGEYSSIRLVYDKKRHFANKHIPDQCVSSRHRCL